MAISNTKMFTACFFIFQIFSHLLSAQNNHLLNRKMSVKKNIIKLFYFNPGAGGYNLAYERVIARKISIQLGLRYIHYGAKELSYHSYNDFYFKPEMRYYLSKKGAPEGLYAGAVAQVEFLKVVYRFSPLYNSIEKEILNGFYLGKEIHLGYQWLIRKRFSVDVNGGVRYLNRIGAVKVKNYNVDGTVTKSRNYFDENAGYFTPYSLLPVFSLMIGFAF
jgi:hypothetical protein